jgi:hypothetical protein
MRGACVLLFLLSPTTPALAQSIVVDRTSLALFDQIPASYIEAARSLRMMFVNRSVGHNVDQGLDCLAYSSPAAAPNSCTRWGSNPPESWSQPYARPNWTFHGWPGLGLPNEVTCSAANGLWTGYQPCFLEHVTPRSSQWDVMSFWFDYLMGSGAGGPLADYFTLRPGNDDVYDLESFAASVAPKTVIFWTTSLPRSDGGCPARSSACTTSTSRRARSCRARRTCCSTPPTSCHTARTESRA